MIRVVIDTNVIVSALNFGGKPNEVLQLANKGLIKLFISPFILEEVSNVLIKQFQWSESKANNTIKMIKEISTLVEPTKQLSIIKEKNSDNRILECAFAANANFLISGDKKHIIPLKRINGIIIINPSEFLSIIDKLPKF
ncbi:MAG: putative toxin-antitoxin system toxin component, PIN family [bacterium]